MFTTLKYHHVRRDFNHRKGRKDRKASNRYELTRTHAAMRSYYLSIQMHTHQINIRGINDPIAVDIINLILLA